MIRDDDAGFSLVELLVALTLFAMIAGSGVVLLGFAADSGIAAKARQAETASLRRWDLLLSADLAQAAPRLTRDPAGISRPAFVGGDGSGEIALAFVRGGWSNPDARPRASLQRVEYALVGDRIERRTAPMLDGAATGTPTVMLTGVRSFRLRYLSRDGWRDRWDPLRPEALPPVVETVVDLDGIGRLRELFVVGAGAPA